MHRRFLFPILLILCFMLNGCFSPTPKEVLIAPTARTLPEYENMEIYQHLRNAVTDDSTLEEMVDAFWEMSKIPVETTTEMFLYEVYTYEYEGTAYLNCHIVRQVDEPDTDEFIQLHMDILYLLDEDISDFHETIWFEADADGFIDHIRSGTIYQTLIGKTIHARYISIDSTW